MKRRFLIIGAIVLLGAAAGTIPYAKMERQRQFDEGIAELKVGNGPAGVRKLEPLARAGDWHAQSALGWTYATGMEGVPKNDELAIQWFRRAGSKDRKLGDGEDPAAEHEYWVAKAYVDGVQGADQNPAESRKWLERAAAGGSQEAMEMLRQQN